MTDRDLIKAELQNLQKILEAKADMCIGAGKIKMLSFAKACNGALELLKEQEPVKPKEIKLGYTEYACGNCDYISVGRKDGYKANFCPNCGHAVKWDEPPKEGDSE